MKILKLSNITPKVLFMPNKTNNSNAVRYIEVTSSDLGIKSKDSSFSNAWNYLKAHLKLGICKLGFQPNK